MRTRDTWMISMAVMLTAVAACSDDDDNGTGSDTEFEATLGGGDEVPAVTTIATGQATISIQGSEIVYTVDVQNLENAVVSHIHVAPEGENGSVRSARGWGDVRQPRRISGHANGSHAPTAVQQRDV